MIISHLHKFIFLKTRKTGGSSVEVALAKICGPDDVRTRITTRDEGQERLRGHNHHIPGLPIPRRRYWLLGPRPARPEFHGHALAAEVERHYPEIFRDYTKITITRNPWDREVSRYFWETHKDDPRPDFADFIQNFTRSNPVDNWEIHSIADRNVADIVLHQERLHEDFSQLCRRFGFDDLGLPHEKAKYRPAETRSYRSLYNDETKAIVGDIYRREIEEFGFTF